MTEALHLMKNIGAYGLDEPVETIILMGPSISNLSVVEASLSTFKVVDGKVVPNATYQLELENPIPEAAFSISSSAGNQFSMHEAYRRINRVVEFDSEERPTTYEMENDIPTTVFRDYPEGRIVAKVTNGTFRECAYTSFETASTGGWNYNVAGCTQILGSVMGISFEHGKTGSRFYNLSAGPITRQIGLGTYVLSFWAPSSAAAPSVTWGQLASSPITDGPDAEFWRYFEYHIGNPNQLLQTLTISGSGSIDELRLYPIDATMETTSFNPDGTVRSKCDINNRVTTYIYDTWKRLEWTLDDNWKILTHHEYFLKDQNNTNDHTWTKDQVIMSEGITKNDVLSASPSDEAVLTSMTYLDGHGRPLQHLAVRQSPNQSKDIVAIHAYDALGREVNKYLPFASRFINNGDYIEDAFNELIDFYDGTARAVNTSYPYAATAFEASPLSRVVKQGHFGEVWQLNSAHATEFLTTFNAADEVLLWEFSGTEMNAMNGLAPQYYPANTLIKKQVTDENGNKVWEFTNTLGQVICKRVRLWMSGSGANSYTWTNGFGRIEDQYLAILPGREPSWRNLDSYYIYDTFGQLKYEIPAIAVLACEGNYVISGESNGLNFSIFDGYLTAYKYDSRSRIVEKKTPGEEWSQYVFNNLNKVILSRSPELTSDQWNFVKYDVFGRVIQTGLHTNSASREDLQNARDLETSNLWEIKSGNNTSPYSSNSFPSSNNQVHTETYYDDYSFDINGYTYSYLGTPQLPQTARNRGVLTGNKVLVLDGGTDYLTSVSYYDTFGRLSVQFSENILGGCDKVLTEYDHSGKPTKSTRHFRKDNSIYDRLTIVQRFEYDHAGRPTITRQKTGNDQEIILSKLSYNEIGQLVKKQIHIAGEANMGMQTIDYRYNERGWLTKINNADLVDDGDNLEHWDVFGEELVYHEQNRYHSTVMDMRPQYNGNIAAIKWKTNPANEDGDASTMKGHSYVFRYDQLGQMLGAFYASSSDTYIDNYSYSVNHWDEKVSYDANGNIRQIRHTRGLSPDGEALSGALVIDNLMNQYAIHSNKLISSDDSSLDSWEGSFTHFIDGVSDETEYIYDAEARVVTDHNKGVTFEYNHLDLVHRVSDGTEQVEITWDATGRKLKMEDNAQSTYYFNGIEYVNDVLTMVATPEGIVRIVPVDPQASSLNAETWVYDYYLKDHLGNVRAVVTEEDSQIEEERVTVELEKRLIEDAHFENVSTTEKDKPFLYPYDPTDPTSQKVTELSSYTGKVIGPAKIMSVKAGERIDVSTKYWYTEEPGQPLTTVAEIFAGTLLKLATASTGIIPTGPDQGMALINNVTGPQFSTLNSFISNSFSNIDLTKPQAFIVFMNFDKNMNLDPSNSGVIQVSVANQLGQLSRTGIQPKRDGFFYVYVTNRSEGRVNFDNMIIKRWAPRVRVVYDYYPYGLIWKNPAEPTQQEGIHDHCYQDKEFQFAEFSAGRGLALYDFHSRMYDPATARWMVPDPAEQFSNPYLAMGNNPVTFVDPDGEFVIEAVIIGALIGGYVGGSVANNSFSISEWDMRDAKTYVGIGLGALAGGFGGYHVGTGLAAKAAASGTKAATKKLLANMYAGGSNAMYSYEKGQGAAETLAYFASGYVSSYAGASVKGFGILAVGATVNTVTGIFTGNVTDGFTLAQHLVAGALATQSGKNIAGPKKGEPILGKFDDKFFSYAMQGTARDFTQAKDFKSFAKKGMDHHIGTFFFSGLGGVMQEHAAKNDLLAGIQSDSGLTLTRTGLSMIGYGIEYFSLSRVKGNYQKFDHKEWENKSRAYGLKLIVNILKP